jgi:YHS domain-containing protein
MKRDPVCGMNVEAEKAITARHGDKTYYFCSDACKETFEKEPEKYADR